MQDNVTELLKEGSFQGFIQEETIEKFSQFVMKTVETEGVAEGM